ncbi:MAG: outer membrane lipoprotein carrier protein LolA [Bacteroidales bacterium]|nr:outer membrane lipoprotein carrier protein LolA [Bacteroidales bacterium]
MNFKSTLFFFSLFITSLAVLSQGTAEKPVDNPAGLIEQASLFSQKTLSITSDFTQEKEMSFLEEKVTSTGKFYFQKENLLRWEYLKPFHYVIILNNNRIRIIDEGEVKDYDAGSNRIFVEISGVMSGLVNGTLLQSDKFGQTWYDAAGCYRVVLTPRETMMKDFLAKIELKLSKQDFSVDELKMFEKSGDYTLITFRNKKMNETIAAEIFNVD